MVRPPLPALCVIRPVGLEVTIRVLRKTGITSEREDLDSILQQIN